MGLKRITARIEAVYGADDPRSLEELADVTQGALRTGLSMRDSLLAAYSRLNASVDPDPEPELPAEPDPGEQRG